MSIKNMFKDFAGSLFKGSLVKEVKENVKETMADIEKKTTKIVHNAIKASVLMIMTMLGLIFALSGLGIYLTETIPRLSHGVGFIVVGGGIIILAIFAKLMQKE